MIPLFFITAFFTGLVFGVLAVFALLALIQRVFYNKYEKRHKISLPSPPPAKFNVDMSTQWLNTLFERTYYEFTKSSNLFPIVSYFCQKVASNEKTIHRLSLIDFTVGHNAPKLNSVRIKPGINGDSVIIYFDFSPELDVNVDLIMHIAKAINITIMAGCAVFFQSLRGGVSILIPENEGQCKVSFTDDVEMSIEVGARIGEVAFNTDEYRFIWQKVKKLIETCIKNVNIRFMLEMPENKEKDDLYKPQKSSENAVFRSSTTLARPTHILFL